MNQRVNTESLGQSLSYQFGGLAFAVDDVIPDEIKGLINETQNFYVIGERTCLTH